MDAKRICDVVIGAGIVVSSSLAFGFYELFSLFKKGPTIDIGIGDVVISAKGIEFGWMLADDTYGVISKTGKDGQIVTGYVPVQLERQIVY